MARMERCDDFPMFFLLSAAISAISVLANRVVAPRPMKIIRSQWVCLTAAWDANVAMRLGKLAGGVSTLLSDTLVAVNAQPNDVFTIDHREEAANSFAAGDLVYCEVTDASATGTLHLLIICRPL